MIMKYKDFGKMLSKDEMKQVKGGFINETCNGRMIFPGGPSCPETCYYTGTYNYEECRSCGQGPCSTQPVTCPQLPGVLCCGGCGYFES